MKNIASAFIKAKKAFSPALKEKNNPAFRSKYADLGACIDAVDDALLDNGIAMYQETFEDATGVTVETVLLHESGEVIRSGKLHVPASKQDPQGFGSALTYARRYSLTWCEDCKRFVPWNDGPTPHLPIPEKYNACSAGHEMKFVAPEGYGDDYGFYRTVCPDRINPRPEGDPK